MAILVAIAGFVVLVICPGGTEMAKFRHRSRSERTLETVIPKNYDPLERPSMTGGPTAVQLSAHLSHIEWSSDKLHLVMYLRQKWNDPRLKRRKPLTVMCKPDDIQSNLWFPDIFLANIIEETKILNVGFVRVSSDGEVIYSAMSKSILSCPHFSMKRLISNDGLIECEIAFESFSYSADELALKWNTYKPAASIDEVYNRKVKAVATGEMTVRLTRGAYSRLSVNLTLDTSVNEDIIKTCPNYH